MLKFPQKFKKKIVKENENILNSNEYFKISKWNVKQN